MPQLDRFMNARVIPPFLVQYTTTKRYCSYSSYLFLKIVCEKRSRSVWVLGSRTPDCRKIRKICAQPPENLCDIIVGARNIHRILSAARTQNDRRASGGKILLFFFVVEFLNNTNMKHKVFYKKKMCIIHETVAALRWAVDSFSFSMRILII